MLDRIKKLCKSSASVNGSYSVAVIAIALVAVVLINLIASKLPENIRNIDVSDTKIYEITDDSKEILKDLDHKISFTVYAEQKSTDDRIESFIEKYAALSDQISVEWIDPVLHPSALTENEASEDTIVVSCEDTGKSKTVAFSDIIVEDEYSYYTTGSSSESEFDGEGQLTAAITQVTSDSQKKIYYTSGHGESAFGDSLMNLLDKNNITTEEVNLAMQSELPEDCDLLVMNGITTDLMENEEKMISSYLDEGGKVMLLLGDITEEVPYLDSLLKAYGMERTEGYIADMDRCYQNNYYYIFPELSDSSLSDGLSNEMFLLANVHGLNLLDQDDETIGVTPILTTSDNAYDVTEDDQTQGSYTIGAYAIKVSSLAEEDSEDAEDSDDEDSDSEDSEAEEVEGRLTVFSSNSLIDSQITDSFTTLENLTLFMNAVTANFDDTENTAIPAKSLEITYNTMQHAGLISILIIFILPLLILIFGLRTWWRRRKS